MKIVCSKCGKGLGDELMGIPIKLICLDVCNVCDKVSLMMGQRERLIRLLSSIDNEGYCFVDNKRLDQRISAVEDSFFQAKLTKITILENQNPDIACVSKQVYFTKREKSFLLLMKRLRRLNVLVEKLDKLGLNMKQDW